jgi:hypothetical protein
MLAWDRDRRSNEVLRHPHVDRVLSAGAYLGIGHPDRTTGRTLRKLKPGSVIAASKRALLDHFRADRRQSRMAAPGAGFARTVTLHATSPAWQFALPSPEVFHAPRLRRRETRRRHRDRPSAGRPRRLPIRCLFGHWPKDDAPVLQSRAATLRPSAYVEASVTADTMRLAVAPGRLVLTPVEHRPDNCATAGQPGRRFAPLLADRLMGERAAC